MTNTAYTLALLSKIQVIAACVRVVLLVPGKLSLSVNNLSQGENLFKSNLLQRFAPVYNSFFDFSVSLAL